MTITRVGNFVVGTAKNGADVTVTFSTAPIDGDVVYVFGGHHTAGGGSYGPSTVGYTQLRVDGEGVVGCGVWRKVMGATPDSTVTCRGSGSGNDVTIYAAAVYRGVSPATPEDVAVPAFAKATSTNPNPPVINPVSYHCGIIICAISTAVDTSPGTPANYATPVGASNSDASGALQIYMSDRILVDEGQQIIEDPPAFPSWSSGSWKAVTVALRAHLPWDVNRLQRALNHAVWYTRDRHVPITGVIDYDTRRSIWEFEQIWEWPQTGEVTQQLLEALDAEMTRKNITDLDTDWMPP